MLYFHWDFQKAKMNSKKHGITFEEASSVFADPLSETFADSRHSIGEERFLIIGKSEQGLILVVAFTENDDIVRIISARKATKAECRYYENG